MKLVLVESPFAGNIGRNLLYLKAVLFDSLQRGEAPFASHALYPQALDDGVPEERALGMQAGFAWGERAELVAVYTDLGISDGMKAGIYRANVAGQPVEYRNLGGFVEAVTRRLERFRAPKASKDGK